MTFVELTMISTSTYGIYLWLTTSRTEDVGQVSEGLLAEDVPTSREHIATWSRG